MHSLSIAQHRTVLVLFVALIAAAVVWQNACEGIEYHRAQKFSPAAALGEIDFTDAEAAWRDLKIDSQGNLVVDALTESSLLDAMTFVNDQHAGKSMERMAFLLEKQLGATATRQIVELLPRLQRYKEAEQRWWTENGSRIPPPHEELFQLQDQMLGETLAKELFSEQRRLMKLMLASQQIRNDARLTPTQRDQALMNLQMAAHPDGESIE